MNKLLMTFANANDDQEWKNECKHCKDLKASMCTPSLHHIFNVAFFKSTLQLIAITQKRVIDFTRTFRTTPKLSRLVFFALYNNICTFCLPSMATAMLSKEVQMHSTLHTRYPITSMLFLSTFSSPVHHSSGDQSSPAIVDSLSMVYFQKLLPYKKRSKLKFISKL